jgi:outer membrane translocation and assembly module TamA
MSLHWPRGVGFWLLALVAAPCARAAITVNIAGIDGELRQNVQVFLSLERYKARNDLDETTFDRLVERADQEVASALRPFGYYEPKVDVSVSKTGGNDRRVTVRVQPGKPVLMTQVTIKVTGEGAQLPAFQRITSSDRLRTGQRLSHGGYDTIKRELLRSASTLGFLEARLLKAELRVDPRNYSATADLELDTGTRYRFGSTTARNCCARSLPSMTASILLTSKWRRCRPIATTTSSPSASRPRPTAAIATPTARVSAPIPVRAAPPPGTSAW